MMKDDSIISITLPVCKWMEENHAMDQCLSVISLHIPKADSLSLCRRATMWWELSEYSSLLSSA